MTELNLYAIVGRLVHGWKTLAVFAIVLVLADLAILPTLRPVYSVHMLIMPAPTDQAPGGSSGGTLSLLLGFAGSGPQGSNYVRYQNLLFSNAVAQRMQDKHGMLQYVFRSDWDAKNHKWIQPHTLRKDLTAWLLRLAHVPVWSPPDVTQLAQFLKGNLVVLPSTANDIVDVSMNNSDVTYATRIMLAANAETNTVLRDQLAIRAGQQVAYLQRKLAQTTVEDYRQTLLALLSSQEKTLMLTQTDASFAAEIISPPMASPTPVSPRPVLSIFVAVLVGCIAGAGIVIFFGPDWWRKSYRKIRNAQKGFLSGNSQSGAR